MIHRRFAVVLIVALAISPARLNAQSTPLSNGTGGDPTQAICSGLLAQGAGTVSGDQTKLCSCLARETPRKLTLADMEAYSEASLNSQPPPAAVMDKVMSLAQACLQEAQ